MLYLAKMDIKKYLFPVVEFLMALVVMEVFIAVGILGGRSGLVSTAIYMYLIVMLLMVFFVLGTAGKVFLGDLRNEQFYPMCKKNGLNRVSILGYMTVIYSAILGIMAALYVGVMGLDILWIRHAFPDIHEEIEQIFSEIIPKENSAALVLSAILDYLFVAVSFVTLVFFAVTMAYNIFTKKRYCGILAGVFTVVFGYFMILVSTKIIAVEDRIQYHLYTALALAIFALAFLAVTHSSVKKHEWTDN